MSARILYWIFKACLLLACLATLAAISFVIIAPFIDQTLITGFALANEKNEIGSFASLEFDVEVDFSIKEASMTIAIPGFLASLLRVIDVLVTGGIWIIFFFLMQQFFEAMTGDRPFSRQSTNGLILGGALLIGFPFWQLLRSIVWQALLFNMIGANQPVLPMFVPYRPGYQWRIVPEVDPLIAISGLVLLVMAKAFLLGSELQQDSDEIV